MAKKEEDSKKKEKIALGQYVEDIVKTAKKAIEKDVIIGTEGFLNTIKGIPHEYQMISILVANSIIEVIQYNKDLLNKPQEDLNIKSKINYNIAEALVVYVSCDKSKYDELVKSAINYYFRSGTHDALKKITYLDQDKTLVSAKAHYQIGNIHFTHIKTFRNHPLTFNKSSDNHPIKSYTIFEWKKLSRQFGNIANLLLLIGLSPIYGNWLILVG